MSKYTDEQINMFQKIADYIYALSDGTNTTTVQVMAEIFPDEIDDIWKKQSYLGVELFVIHYEVMELLGKMGVLLDMSSHDGKVEGLPHNLDFYVKHI